MSARCALLPLLLACTDKASDSASPVDTRVGDSAQSGLPEGESTWEGTIEVSGLTFPMTLTLQNTLGDLAGVATFSDNPDSPLGIGTGTYSVTGTHEPENGLVALAPEDWIDPPDIELELLGFSGTYDPSADTLSGTAADYASGSDNTLTGGPTLLTRTGGEGTPTDFGDAALALPVDTRPFTGTHQCTGSEREVAGELTYDGGGSVSGTISFGDPTLAESTNTFAFTGVHNPSTGGLTLIPGLYTQTDASFATFFIEATYDPATDRFPGEGRINVGSCPDGLWQVGF